MLTMSLKGDKELVAKLMSLTKSEFKHAMQEGSKKALEPVKKTARALAPKDTKKLSRAMRTRVLRRSRVRVGARIVVGANDSMFRGRTFYAAFQEYGWRSGKRADNSSIGIRKGKKRNLVERFKVRILNASRKRNKGTRYLERAAKTNRAIVKMTFNGYVRKGIHKAIKRTASRKAKETS